MRKITASEGKDGSSLGRLWLIKEGVRLVKEGCGFRKFRFRKFRKFAASVRKDEAD